MKSMCIRIPNIYICSLDYVLLHNYITFQSGEKMGFLSSNQALFTVVLNLYGNFEVLS